MIRYNMTRYVMIRSYMIQGNKMRCNMRYAATRCNKIQYDANAIHVIQFDARSRVSLKN